MVRRTAPARDRRADAGPRPGHRAGRRLRVAAAALATVAAASVALAAPSIAQAAAGPAAVTVDTTAAYTLTARHSGQVLQVQGPSGDDGAIVAQEPAVAGATSQQWRFTALGSGYYRLTSVRSGKALDVNQVSTADGARIQQWAVTNGANQAWALRDAGSGAVTLVARHSGKAADVSGASTAAGAAVIQWPVNGGANQAWTLGRVGATAGGGTASSGGTAGGSSGGVTGTPPASPPGAGIVSGDTATHDPSMTKGPDGTYVLMGTAPGLSITTSTDRTAFRYRGVAFPGGASWTDAYTHTSNGNLWAPDISYHNGRFYLYYAASSFGSNNSAVFLATSTTAMPGTWSNQGMVIASTSSMDYNAIDPNLFVGTDGRWWLTFGSFWNGIRQIQLDPSTGLRTGNSLTSVAARPGSTAVEAPFVFRHGSSYYLFVSFDLCCRGTNSTYRIMVGRSASPNGPFSDRNGQAMTNGGGTQILASHGRWIGPGGQSVFADADSDVLVYHYYDGQDNGNAKLGINLLGWDSGGWPYVH